jgi:hypothetical protein
MLGTISLILALNDSMILSGTDLNDVFFNYLRTQPNRKYLYLVTLRSLNISKSSILPCIVSGKIPMESPDTFHPSTWGHIIISSLVDGSLTIIKLVDRSSKMPEYQGDADEGNERKQNLKGHSTVFDYPYFRKELKIGKDAVLNNGSYIIGMISGDIMSEFQQVAVTSSTSAEDRSSSLSTPQSPMAKQDVYLFAKTQYSPPIPTKPGIALAAVPKEKAQKGKPFMVYGAIRRLSDKSLEKNLPQVVHILVSGPEESDLSHYQIKIPATMQKKENGFIVSYFAFDCMKEFFYQEGGRFDVPDYFFISAINKELHVGPVKVVTR